MLNSTSTPSIYRPRRPRASPLWQIVHHSWDDFLAGYESTYRKTHGPLHPFTVEAVNDFYKCGDLSAGFTRLHCPNPDCGHERLLAFTCKSRHFCPACHQRRVCGTAAWIAETLCKPVPHRQFVFTIPRMLRGIFRKRRHLLDHLFRAATESLRDWMRLQLDHPPSTKSKLAAIAGVQTFGDYLVWHPHIHILSASGLFDDTGLFHLLPAVSKTSLDALTELFRHRFIRRLVDHKLLTEKKARDLLNWKHSGFNLDAGEKPVAANDADGRRDLAEYLLRAPFSLQKITWKAETATVIYRSGRNWKTKRNFEVFSATDFRRRRCHPPVADRDLPPSNTSPTVTTTPSDISESTPTNPAASNKDATQSPSPASAPSPHAPRQTHNRRPPASPSPGSPIANCAPSGATSSCVSGAKTRCSAPSANPP